MATVTSLGLPVPDEDLCHLVWRAPAWLSEQAASHAAPPSSTFGVTPSNALEYFSLSPFFDRRSTNQTLMMQTMYSNQAPLDHARMAEELKRFVGVEYALLDGQSSEGAFVIEKRYRQDPATTFPIATYMILRGSIYQSPNLHSVLSVRLRSSILAINDMLDLARSARPPFDAHRGYAWRIKAPPAASVEDKPVEVATEAKKAPAPADAFNPLLARALQTTWTSLTAPPPAPAPPQPPGPGRTPSAAPASRAPSQPPPAPLAASPVQTGTGTSEDQPKQSYRIGPTGKRKPHRAA